MPEFFWDKEHFETILEGPLAWPSAAVSAGTSMYCYKAVEAGATFWLVQMEPTGPRTAASHRLARPGSVSNGSHCSQTLEAMAGELLAGEKSI